MVIYIQRKRKRLQIRQKEIYKTTDRLFTKSHLREICISNKWFTEGSNSQYNKLFELNDDGADLDQLSLVIWLCSDSEKWSENEIYKELMEERQTVEAALEAYKQYSEFEDIAEKYEED